jgi:hypothetical protein
MLSKEEFIREWKFYWVGVALCGTVDDRVEGPLAKGMRANTLPAEIEKKLGLMYDSITEGGKMNGMRFRTKPANGALP